MNRRRYPILFAAACALSLIPTSSTWACGGCQGGGFFPWFGYGMNGPAAYALGNIPSPPYFALHPPVYYSHRITPRSYGSSPFANPSACGAPIAAAPVRRANPFLMMPAPAPATKNEQEKPVNVAVTPVRIQNPFYAPALAQSPQ